MNQVIDGVSSMDQAQLEGGFVQNELYGEAIDKYYETYGTMPSQFELENIDVSLLNNLKLAGRCYVEVILRQLRLD